LETIKTPFFWLFSIIWSVINCLNRGLIKIGITKPIRLESQVISVGNIQAGGSGKTPLIALIAEQAHQRGLSVCILTRGYHSAWEKHGGIIHPGSDEMDPSVCGDEPALLHKLCPFATIGVGKNRVKQYRAVQAEKKIDLVLLDDGFQNRKIIKDLDIVAWTSAKPGQRLFREFESSLKRADLVVWTKGCRPPPALTSQPVVKISYDLSGAPNYSPDSFKAPLPLWLITGVADPRSVRELLVKSGYSVTKHTVYRDHFRYSSSLIKQTLNKASQENLRVALTGKDWVKWKSQGFDLVKSPDVDVMVFEPKIRFEKGMEIWNRVLWNE